MYKVIFSQKYWFEIKPLQKVFSLHFTPTERLFKACLLKLYDNADRYKPTFKVSSLESKSPFKKF